MCDKHKPIPIYEGGGKATVCSACGKVLEEWKSYGEGKLHDEKTKKKEAPKG